LIVAMVVTLACLPLVVLDLMGEGGGGGASEAAVVDTDVPESSLVVAVSPEDSPTTTAVPPSSTTVAPTTTVKKPAATTSTTAAPTARQSVATTPPTTAAPVVSPPPTAAGGAVGWEIEFMECVRWRESRNNYGAVDPSGQFMGAYQIYQGGWDAVARSIGRSDLVGVPPHRAAPADQDTVAINMLRQYGTSPWGGTCG
jgi:hypothetical protein